MKRCVWILSLLAATGAAGPAGAGGVATGETAPAFTLPDTAGKEHALADFHGKYVVLEWINYGCPFVKKHYKNGDMQSLQKKYGGMDDVVWLAVCSSAPGKQGHMSAEEAQAANEEHGFAGAAYLLDEDGAVGRAYGARRTPHMFVIDPEGRVAYQGAIDSIASADPADIAAAENYVAASLDVLRAGGTPDPSTTKPYGCGVKY